jgi:hypothetical protein
VSRVGNFEPSALATVSEYPALLGIELKNAVSAISFGVNDADNVRAETG